jgi:effector-binding domain-containing protein
MSTKNKIVLGILSLLGIVCLGYFILWPADYIIRFQAPALPGTINQTLKTWSSANPNAKTIEQDGSILSLRQEFQFSDSTHVYQWNLDQVHDSLTDVKVYINDPKHRISNRLSNLFSSDTDLKKRAKKTVLDFYDKLVEHKNSFKVEIIGEVEMPTTYTAYVESKSKQYSKAAQMMRQLPLLEGFVVENEIELKGYPFIEITKWDRAQDSIHLRFGYPVVRNEKLIVHPEIKYKRFFGKKALKAVFNGNYINSDRAWYALLNYAEKNGIEVEETPIEIFHNNPNYGGNSMRWKAEIFMPIKEKE